MRTTLLALLLLLGAGPALATGSLSCTFKDANLALEAEATVSRGVGEGFISFGGKLDVAAKNVPDDLRKVPLALEHLTQRWLYAKDLKLRVYHERPGSGLHGYVELIVEAKQTPREETEYRGNYVLTIYHIPSEGSGRQNCYLARPRRLLGWLRRNTVEHATHIIRTVSGLAAANLVAASDAHALEAVAARYAVAITPNLARLIDRSDPHDPIARQFVPDARELDHKPEELADPIGDETHTAVPGVVHRYPDRVLLKLTHVCPVYCRFCFRREVVGPGGPQALSEEAIDAAAGYIASDPGIWEVILTGGDPFMLSPRRIARVTERLSAIPHVKILRWHTRVPVAEPGRVTPDLVAALKSGSKTVFVALHANHPRELTHEARTACARIVDAGIPILSQSVLLKGVNDDADTLATLMRSFVEMRIKPYYLHHPDLAPGTSHFRMSIAEGQDIVRQLRGRVSGLAQPTYVLDIPGGHGKVPVGPRYVEDGHGSVIDPAGSAHNYP